MKSIARFTAIFLLLAGISTAATAQSGHKHHHNEWTEGDTTIIEMNGVKVHKIGKDSLVVYINRDEAGCCNFGSFPFKKHKKKYNGHWAGVDLGFNGYATPDFDMNFYPGEEYMNLNTARSLGVNLNPFELNINICRNHFGFTTGLGFQLNNYYFTGNYVMIGDSSELKAYKVQDQYGNYVTLKQNKLFNSYLTLPVLFEYQTNRGIRANSFHVSLGVIAGVRIGSYSKQKYDATEQTYYLVDDNGTKVAQYYVNDEVVRNWGSYHLSPFKVDASFRIGWSFLNLWTTYALTPMFQKNQGPELYPWNVGITLVGW